MRKSFALTDIGRHRRKNQDSIFASDLPVGQLPDLYLVADGMGGHKGGEYASAYTRDRLVEICEEAREQDPDLVIPGALDLINSGLRAIAASDFRYAGMGTTVVCAVIQDASLFVYNVGDSRLYLLPEEGPLRQVTTDHSLVEEMVRAGKITREQAAHHPRKNVITRALGGGDSLRVDAFTLPLGEKDRILLCSDGLTNMVKDPEIEEILRGTDDPESAALRLRDRANEKGGLDNISVVLVYPDREDA